MQIWLNGSAYEVTDGVTTIQQLLEYLKVDHKISMVEQNGKVLHKEEYLTAPLSMQDRVEIVHFVGGG